MRSHALVGSSPLATVCLTIVQDGPAETVYRLDVQHIVPDARNVASDLFDEAEAFGEPPGGDRRVHLVLRFADWTCVDSASSLQVWARGTTDGGEDWRPRHPLLVGGEGSAYETDARPTRSAERVFRLAPRPSGPLVEVELRWLALGIEPTLTAW
ncbi:hypothetical protein AB1207_05225 [Kineococcus endophyticus]|uniref:Uncharacterized protein n=1 Tax=Kineococcus endophyticus TaxID=1181883 RepID=A0ABV3P3E7_9ACTN